MKTKSILLVATLAFLLSGCFVFSFYPLYTEKDLFVNDLLLGKWTDADSTVWHFEYKQDADWPMQKPIPVDSTTYVLRLKEKGQEDFSNSALLVRVVKLENNYFLDFYLKDYLKDDQDLFKVHLLPVHSFAKLELGKGTAKIRWFDPEWLSELIKQNKIRIHHEKDDDRILLTAKPEELQKFVTKYVNSNEAFNVDMDIDLEKIKQ